MIILGGSFYRTWAVLDPNVTIGSVPRGTILNTFLPKSFLLSVESADRD